MADIESLGYELVYKAAEGVPAPGTLDTSDGKIGIRSELRALTGMQKEALVYDSQTGVQWRMVCDEGPYLNGTDLAPFPLAFYTTGMAFSFTTELMKHAKAAGIEIKNYKLTQDNYYTMQGSAIRGNMIGGALPVEMAVEIESDASSEALQVIIDKAEQTSPAQRYMNNEMENLFALSHNGQAVSPGDVTPSENQLQPEPTPHLEAAKPLDTAKFERDIITKGKGAETVFGVEGGAGSSLQATQKRTLHVRGVVTIQDDGLLACDIQLFKPRGSNFRLLGDESGNVRAPSSLSYLSAGVGFCFMTQIGRYAQIVKQDLKGYSVVQDSSFAIGTDGSEAFPVDTHTYLEMGEDDAAAQKNLYMSERTCFLHAAMRGSTKTVIKLEHQAS
ncbi:MAG: OsmC family protein [Anaerolineae bacterium]